MRVWWTQAVRRNRLISLRKILKGSLPTLPVFVNSFGGLISQIQEIPGIPALSVATVSNMTVQDFTDLQKATREQKIKPALQAISDSVQEVYFSMPDMYGYISKLSTLGLRPHLPNQKFVIGGSFYWLCPFFADHKLSSGSDLQSMGSFVHIMLRVILESKTLSVQGIEQMSAGIQARVRSEQEQSTADMQGSLKYSPGVELIRGLPSTKSRSMGAIKAEQLEQAR